MELKKLVPSKVFVGLRWIEVENPKEEWEIEISKKGSEPFDSHSKVKFMFLCLELRYSWNKGTCSSLRKTTKQSSM